MIEWKIVGLVILVVWADLRLAFWNLSRRLDEHLDNPHHIERRKAHV